MKAVGRTFCMQAIQDHGQPFRSFGIDFTDRSRCVVAQSLQDTHGRCRPKRRVSSQHCVQHAAETEQVSSLINRVPAGLFGGHVLRSSRNHAALRHAGIVDRPRQSEVRDANTPDAVLQQNIAGFDVSMDDSLRVSGGEALSNLQSDAHGFAGRK